MRPAPLLIGAAFLVGTHLAIALPHAAAVDLPNGFFVENAASGDTFEGPIGLAFAPDGRVFVCLKDGRVMIIDANGDALSTPFIDLRDEVLNQHDRGLLGITLHPDFASNGYVYLLYTVDWQGTDENIHTFGRLTRYTAMVGNPNVADLASRLVLIGDTWGRGFPNCDRSHAIGSVRFGSDSTLLVGCGDASSFSVVDDGGLHPTCYGPGRFDPLEDIGAFKSQYNGSLAGKIIRIDPDTGLGLASNPYYTGDPDDNESRVWVKGLRNPYRFMVRLDGSNDPADADPGALYIGDVGWGGYEELNIAPNGGENFGWPCFEGPFEHDDYQDASPAHSDCSTIDTPANPGPLTMPAASWAHPAASAVISGGFYLGSKYPGEYQGRYFHGDYVDGWVRMFDVDASDHVSNEELFAEDMGAIVDFEYDPYSEYFFYVDVVAGTVMRIRHVDEPENVDPVAIAAATPVSGTPPLDVSFNGSASFDPDGDPLTYQWEFGDGGTSSFPNPDHTYPVLGDFTVTLTVADDAGGSDTATLTITVGNNSPTVTIISPIDGSQGLIGQGVVLEAIGSDPDQSDINLTYEWDITLVHGNHQHADVYSSTENPALYVVEQHGIPEEVTYLLVDVTVTDDGGLTATDRHHLLIERPEESDVTDVGTTIRLVDNPEGPGNTNVSVIHDGVFPPVGSTNTNDQYANNTPGPRDIDWIGYSFSSDRKFTSLIYQEGIEFEFGGWFDSYDVEVRIGGAWQSVSSLQTVVPYFSQNGTHFETFTLLFDATIGDAIRLIGAPGGESEFLSIGELRVLALPYEDDPPPPPDEGTNLSLLPGVVASQSSTDFGGDPERAIDGDTNGSFFEGSVTHTGFDQNAWWKVDLTETYQLAGIRIWNRTDCCDDILSNFYILISDVPFVSDDLDAALAQEGVTSIYVPDAIDESQLFSVDRTGRYVRVQLDYQEVLTLAEVEVFAAADGTSVVSAAPAPALHLGAPYPNPFRAGTTLTYELPESTALRLGVYDVHGRLVRTLEDGTIPPGSRTARWDGRDASGRRVSSGLYWLRLESNIVRETRKLLLVR